jgi:hypothetical protein
LSLFRPIGDKYYRIGPIGEASRVVEGVHQLKLPVPFPLKFIASYLAEGRDGWTVIDPGFDYPPAREP